MNHSPNPPQNEKNIHPGSANLPIQNQGNFHRTFSQTNKDRYQSNQENPG